MLNRISIFALLSLVTFENAVAGSNHKHGEETESHHKQRVNEQRYELEEKFRYFAGDLKSILRFDCFERYYHAFSDIIIEELNEVFPSRLSDNIIFDILRLNPNISNDQIMYCYLKLKTQQIIDFNNPEDFGLITENISTHLNDLAVKIQSQQ